MLILTCMTLLSLSGCQNKTVYIRDELPLPDAPVLPIVKRDELNCLSQDVIDRLSKRQLILYNYIHDLKLVIKSTHGKPE